MIFHSDLDLLFVYDHPSSDREAVRELLAFVKAVKSALYEYTSYGRAYTLDFRLRPEGRSATDIISRDQLVEYFSSRAETWERLAYIKARPVCDRGCPLPFPDVLRGGGLNSAEIDGLLHIRLRKEEELGREKSTGSRDFKIGRGGVLDTQFFIQMLQLKHDVYEPNTLDAIPALADAGLLSPLEKETLREIVSFFYALESAADLTSPPGESEPRLSLDSSHTENIARLLGYDSPGSLLDRFESLAERNRAFLARLGKL